MAAHLPGQPIIRRALDSVDFRPAIARVTAPAPAASLLQLAGRFDRLTMVARRWQSALPPRFQPARLGFNVISRYFGPPDTTFTPLDRAYRLRRKPASPQPAGPAPARAAALPSLYEPPAPLARATAEAAVSLNYPEGPESWPETPSWPELESEPELPETAWTPEPGWNATPAYSRPAAFTPPALRHLPAFRTATGLVLARRIAPAEPGRQTAPAGQEFVSPVYYGASPLPGPVAAYAPLLYPERPGEPTPGGASGPDFNPLPVARVFDRARTFAPEIVAPAATGLERSFAAPAAGRRTPARSAEKSPALPAAVLPASTASDGVAAATRVSAAQAAAATAGRQPVTPIAAASLPGAAATPDSLPAGPAATDSWPEATAPGAPVVGRAGGQAAAAQPLFGPEANASRIEATPSASDPVAGQAVPESGPTAPQSAAEDNLLSLSRTPSFEAGPAQLLSASDAAASRALGGNVAPEAGPARSLPSLYTERPFGPARGLPVETVQPLERSLGRDWSRELGALRHNPGVAGSLFARSDFIPDFSALAAAETLPAKLARRTEAVAIEPGYSTLSPVYRQAVRPGQTLPPVDERPGARLAGFVPATLRDLPAYAAGQSGMRFEPLALNPGPGPLAGPAVSEIDRFFSATQPPVISVPTAGEAAGLFPALSPVQRRPAANRPADQASAGSTRSAADLAQPGLGRTTGMPDQAAAGLARPAADPAQTAPASSSTEPARARLDLTTPGLALDSGRERPAGAAGLSGAVQPAASAIERQTAAAAFQAGANPNVPVAAGTLAGLTGANTAATGREDISRPGAAATEPDTLFAGYYYTTSGQLTPLRRTFDPSAPAGPAYNQYFGLRFQFPAADGQLAGAASPLTRALRRVFDADSEAATTTGLYNPLPGFEPVYARPGRPNGQPNRTIAEGRAAQPAVETLLPGIAAGPGGAVASPAAPQVYPGAEIDRPQPGPAAAASLQRWPGPLSEQPYYQPGPATAPFFQPPTGSASAPYRPQPGPIFETDRPYSESHDIVSRSFGPAGLDLTGPQPAGEAGRFALMRLAQNYWPQMLPALQANPGLIPQLDSGLGLSPADFQPEAAGRAPLYFRASGPAALQRRFGAEAAAPSGPAAAFEYAPRLELSYRLLRRTAPDGQAVPLASAAVRPAIFGPATFVPPVLRDLAGQPAPTLLPGELPTSMAAAIERTTNRSAPAPMVWRALTDSPAGRPAKVLPLPAASGQGWLEAAVEPGGVGSALSRALDRVGPEADAEDEGWFASPVPGSRPAELSYATPPLVMRKAANPEPPQAAPLPATAVWPAEDNGEEKFAPGRLPVPASLRMRRIARVIEQAALGLARTPAPDPARTPRSDGETRPDPAVWAAELPALRNNPGLLRRLLDDDMAAVLADDPARPLIHPQPSLVPATAGLTPAAPAAAGLARPVAGDDGAWAAAPVARRHLQVERPGPPAGGRLATTAADRSQATPLSQTWTVADEAAATAGPAALDFAETPRFSPNAASIGVMSQPNPAALIQRKAAVDGPVKLDTSGVSMAHTLLRTAVGRPLEARVQRSMGALFRTSFEHVRVHHDDHSADFASRIGAEAFTVGPNIFFGAGRYQPHTPAGQALLGHELTHVMQQSNLPSLSHGRSLETTDHGHAMEQQATQVERIIMRHLSSDDHHSDSLDRAFDSSDGPGGQPLSFTPVQPVHLRSERSGSDSGPSASAVQRVTDDAPVQRVNGSGTSSESSSNDSQPAEPDIDAIAKKVYQLLKHQLIMERERNGARGGYLYH